MAKEPLIQPTELRVVIHDGDRYIFLYFDRVKITPAIMDEDRSHVFFYSGGRIVAGAILNNNEKLVVERWY